MAELDAGGFAAVFAAASTASGVHGAGGTALLVLGVGLGQSAVWAVVSLADASYRAAGTILAMAIAARKLARPDAADRVADACVALGAGP